MLPFNRPCVTGVELDYIRQAIDAGHLSGDGQFTKLCQQWLENQLSTPKVLLTHSCTAALELAAILSKVGPGDEVIMPSFTFASTANAFVLRGATPVFVDIRRDTLNLDERLVADAVTERTRAIVPVHYAGVACEMDAILDLANRHELVVIEDAAQGLMSRYRGRPLGSIGHIGALSFHETKNVISGEGGALILGDGTHIARAEIIREKGTNRSAYFRGQVDKYTWVDIGSSYLPSDIIAAFLWAQLEHAESLTARRLALWNRYHDSFEELETDGIVRRPIVPAHCTHNAHMYYLLLQDLERREALIASLRSAGIGAVFHYVPLHSSPAGLRWGRLGSEMSVTPNVSDRLVRLPLWAGIESRIDEVIGRVREAILAIR